jgi:hypothetical protein
MSHSTDVQRQTDHISADDQLQPFEDFVEYLREYAREQPEMAALVCFGVGFFLGWKLKPW